MIDVSCDIKICPKNSAQCLKICDPDAEILRDTNIMVIQSSLDASYLTNGDGSTNSAAQITAPNNVDNFASYSATAFVAGQLYFFGGQYDSRKIARLDSCAIVTTNNKLLDDFSSGHAALATKDGSQAIICFGSNTPPHNCNTFDGSSVEYTHVTTVSHRFGGLGYYNGKPTTVGSVDIDGHQKVETLGETGWSSLANHPMNHNAHSLVGLSNGDMLTIGGRTNDEFTTFQTSVWRLSNNNWNIDGSLVKALAYGSALITGQSIYIFPGWANGRTETQRLDLHDDNTIEKVTVIGNQNNNLPYPILFITERDSCQVP